MDVDLEAVRQGARRRARSPRLPQLGERHEGQTERPGRRHSALRTAVHQHDLGTGDGQAERRRAAGTAATDDRDAAAARLDAVRAQRLEHAFGVGRLPLPDAAAGVRVFTACRRSESGLVAPATAKATSLCGVVIDRPRSARPRSAITSLSTISSQKSPNCSTSKGT